MGNSWTLEDALVLIRKLQPQTRQFAYHLALGGGVLNTGRSDKDLDLYLLPMGYPQCPPQPVELRAHLTTLWGTEYTLGGPSVRTADIELVYPPEPIWVSGRFTYWPDGRRIDVFIA